MNSLFAQLRKTLNGMLLYSDKNNSSDSKDDFGNNKANLSDEILLDNDFEYDDNLYADELHFFKKKIKFYSVFGVATILGQIVSFNRDKCIVLLTLNQPNVIEYIKLDGDKVSVLKLGSKAQYFYRKYQDRVCYYLEIDKPIIKLYSRLEFKIHAKLNLNALLDKRFLEDTRVKIKDFVLEPGHALILKPEALPEDILYYLGLYFGSKFIYNFKEFELSLEDLIYWKVKKDVINIECNYINSDGENQVYLKYCHSLITRKMHLPFICDIKKIKEIISRFILKEHKIACIIKEPMGIMVFDRINIMIGYIRYTCVVLDQYIYEKNGNIYQKILAKILN